MKAVVLLILNYMFLLYAILTKPLVKQTTFKQTARKPPKSSAKLSLSHLLYNFATSNNRNITFQC